jgi:AcrR family transcriptional regulator
MTLASTDAVSDRPDNRPGPRLRMHRRGDPGRAEVEAFVADVFARRFGASLRDFAPCLVSLHDGDGIVAAAGYRRAGDGPLFLEAYLDAPVERLLAPGAGTAPSRPAIVEVGHLAAARAGEGRHLIRLLGAHLATQGFQWVVGTLTEELRHLFVRLGVAPLALGRADPRLLGDAARCWGSYYDHSPVVLAGFLPQALRQLARRPLLAGAAR